MARRVIHGTVVEFSQLARNGESEPRVAGIGRLTKWPIKRLEYPEHLAMCDTGAAVRKNSSLALGARRRSRGVGLARRAKRSCQVDLRRGWGRVGERIDDARGWIAAKVIDVTMDPRYNPFDWETWYECDVFRAEVEAKIK